MEMVVGAREQEVELRRTLEKRALAYCAKCWWMQRCNEDVA